MKENRTRIVNELRKIEAYQVDIDNVESGDADMYKIARSYGVPKFPPIEKFQTHTREIVKGRRLKDALNHVADFWRDNAIAIRESDDYASHVTEARKDENMNSQIRSSEYIRAGHVESFTISQRVNTYLTGECIALLP